MLVAVKGCADPDEQGETMHYRTSLKRLTIVLTLTIGFVCSASDINAEQNPPVIDWLKTSDDFRSGFALGLVTSLSFFGQQDPNNRELVMQIANELHDCVDRKGLDVNTAKVAIEGYIRNNPQRNNSHIYLVSISAIRKLCQS